MVDAVLPVLVMSFSNNGLLEAIIMCISKRQDLAGILGDIFFDMEGCLWEVRNKLARGWEQKNYLQWHVLVNSELYFYHCHFQKNFVFFLPEVVI